MEQKEEEESERKARVYPRKHTHAHSDQKFAMNKKDINGARTLTNTFTPREIGSINCGGYFCCPRW